MRPARAGLRRRPSSTSSGSSTSCTTHLPVERPRERRREEPVELPAARASVPSPAVTRIVCRSSGMPRLRSSWTAAPMAARRASTGALGSGRAGTSVTIVARPPRGTMPASGGPESGKRTASRTAAPTSVIAWPAGSGGMRTTASSGASTTTSCVPERSGIAHTLTLDSEREPEDDHGRGARPRRRAGARGGSLPRRRQQPRLQGVFRAARGARDERRLSHERAARLHEHARQAALGLPPAGRRGGLGHEARAPHGHLRRVQVRPPPDARSAARAVAVLQADRGGLRLPQPRVRRLGGGRRHRHSGDPRRRGGRAHVRRLDRPRRVPAGHGERLPDDDAARRRRRARLHARARHRAPRRAAREGS